MKISSFWQIEFVFSVMSNWDMFLKNWKWFSNSVNNKGFFSWNDIDLSNSKFQRNCDFCDCLVSDKMKFISFK